jgi:uncharacterized coiled-coil DUF342 family protein
MFTTIKAQIVAYKWIIIISFIGLLTLGLGWQYHRASMLENKTDELKNKNVELSKKLDKTNKQFDEYKVSTDKALADLLVLRNNLNEISSQTAAIQSKINGLKKAPVIADGANAGNLEAEANQITKQVFQRFENASRGKTK